MMAVYLLGIGSAAIATGLARSPLQVGAGLFAIGIFAAIYHPVGLAIVTAKWKNTGSRLAVNGVWGNFGVAGAAFLTGYLIDHGGWRSAFLAAGAFSFAIGITYLLLRWPEISQARVASAAGAVAATATVPPATRAVLLRISMIVFVTAAVSSIVFQSTTFALPTIFDERLQGLAAALVAWRVAVACTQSAR